MHLARRLLFAMPYLAICYLGLAAFADTENFVADNLFQIALFLFAFMIIEDWLDMTVDVRCTAVLAILLVLSSAQPAGNFLLTGVLAFICFRLFYLLSIVCHAWRCKRQPCIQTESCTKVVPSAMPFLPSFGIGILCYALCCLLLPNALTFLEPIQDTMQVVYEAVAPQLVLVGIFIVLFAWLTAEMVFRSYRKHWDDVEAGLGMGDVIVLPLFAAFLGITTFSLVLLLACFIHIGIYFFRCFIHWEV